MDLCAVAPMGYFDGDISRQSWLVYRMCVVKECQRHLAPFPCLLLTPYHTTSAIASLFRIDHVYKSRIRNKASSSYYFNTTLFAALSAGLSRFLFLFLFPFLPFTCQYFTTDLHSFTPHIIDLSPVPVPDPS